MILRSVRSFKIGEYLYVVYNITCKINVHFKWNFYIYNYMYTSIFCNLWVKELYGDNIHPRELIKKKNEIVHLKIKIYSHYYYNY